ncbi:MAG: LysR family transcriptional regulator [Nannocystaceae bacterium]|nr:LysR family transcriptional regulator [Nannocystaceae bacterium]
MSETDLSGIDLNLLVSLRALLLERHVTRAAQRVGLSQPAMSRALSRLRDVFADPLLVRVGSTMQATPRALALLANLEDVLARIGTLVSPAAFDPSSATGEIRLAAPDVIVHQLIPPLLKQLARTAPSLTVRVVEWSLDWRRQLESGEIELSIGAPVGTETGIYAREFTRLPWACVLRKNHPALRKRWNVATFAKLDHLVVTLDGRGGSVIDDALRQDGHVRRVALRVPYHYASVTPLLIVESDLVLTTSAWIAQKYAQFVPLVIRKLPVHVPPIHFAMVWHERTHRDSKSAWIRSQLGIAADAADPSLRMPV